MAQQGQVFKLKSRTADGRPLWAYRYRLQGRGSRRIQVGGFATRAEAQQDLERTLARLRPGGRAATLTLADFVEEYLQADPGLPVTVSKLRWLLRKATSALGDVRLVDLTPEQVCRWRMTIPEGHRYEATQALRQVLNRAVAWELLESNPAKRGVPNPLRRSLEKRGRSIRGSKSKRSLLILARCMDRWCSLPRRQGCGRRSCLRSSTATSITGKESSTSVARMRTGASSM